MPFLRGGQVASREESLVTDLRAAHNRSLVQQQEQGCVPHSAFLDKARLGEEGLKPRQSIELRCAVLF